MTPAEFFGRPAWQASSLGVGGFEVWGLGFRVWGSGFRVWGLGIVAKGFGASGLRFRV